MTGQWVFSEIAQGYRYILWSPREISLSRLRWIHEVSLHCIAIFRISAFQV